MGGIALRSVRGAVEPMGVWHRPSDKTSPVASGHWGTSDKPLGREHLADLHTYLGQIGGNQTGTEQLVAKARLIAQEHVEQLASNGKYVGKLTDALPRPLALGGVLDEVGRVQARDWDQVSLYELKKHSLSELSFFDGHKMLQVVDRQDVNGQSIDGVRTIYLKRDAAASIEKQLFSIALLKERAAGPVQTWYERASAAYSPFAPLIEKLVQTINLKRQATSLEAWKQGQQAVLDAKKEPQPKPASGMLGALKDSSHF